MTLRIITMVLLATALASGYVALSNKQNPLQTHANSATETGPIPLSESPLDHLQVRDLSSAIEKRQAIISFLWNGQKTLPSMAPTVDHLVHDDPTIFKTDLSGIEPALTSKVERLEYSMPHTYRHLTYMIYPSEAYGTPHNLMIIHQGHQGGLGDGIGDLANQLLRRGIVVALTQMPLVDWNNRTPPAIPGYGRIKAEGTRGHDELFKALSERSVSAMSFFIEPIIAINNHVERNHPEIRHIGMAGLSGGGWTTHLTAAIDDRIEISFPVAGSYPLYLRPYFPGSAGDAEQIAPGLYRDRATWLDIYVLGGAGSGRKQLQLLNQHDPCCFHGKGGEHYASTVSNVASQLAGEWALVIDDTHREHQLSAWGRSQILNALEESGWIDTP